MPDSITAVFIVLMTFPGFLGFLALHFFSARPIDDGIRATSWIILLNVISYLAVALLLPSSDSRISFPTDSIEFTEVFTVRLALQSSISVLTAFFFSKAADSVRLQEFFLRTGIRKKTGQGSVFESIASYYPEHYIRFWFEDGSYVVGHPLYYSCDSDSPAMFVDNSQLRQAPYLDADGKRHTPNPRNVLGPGTVVDLTKVKFAEVLEGV